MGQYLCGWIGAVARWSWGQPAASLLVICLLSAGCEFFATRSGTSTDYNLPLTVLVRVDPSIASANIEYRDACGQPGALPINDAVEKQLKKRLSQVFQRIQIRTADSRDAADGAVDVALGFREVNLFIPRKANKSYPATVTLGLDFSYTDQRGAVLHSKKLQSSATGEVETQADRCQVSGLDAVAQEAVAMVVEGMAQQLGTATKIREQAQLGKTNPPASIPPLSNPSAGPAESASVAASSSPPNAERAPGALPQVPPVETPVTATKLSFRTIIRDDNQNHVLEQQEAFSVEFEIKNEGAGVAQAIEIDLSGHAAIVAGLKSPVPVGTLQPAEVRRVAVDGKVGAVAGIEQAELICTLRASANVELPSSKKFLVAIRPDRSDAVEVLSVDVDQLPKANGKSAQPHAIGIAIGVGGFRDSAMRGSKFAVHDAEVMGAYFKRVLNIPPPQVKVVLDNQGLKDDLIDVFEQWLPKQSTAQHTAYIYISGRAVVDAETGAVSLLPYDGSVAGASRVFSLARLQRALSRASLKQAVLMLDLSLELPSGASPAGGVSPQWSQQNAPDEQHTRLLIMVGNSGIQEAQGYQAGQHGLFTYFLLKGLRGAADLDKDGAVLTGELCTYVREQVTSIVRSTLGGEQHPLCVPESGRGASSLLQLPLSKSR